MKFSLESRYVGTFSTRNLARKLKKSLKGFKRVIKIGDFCYFVEVRKVKEKQTCSVITVYEFE